jgi:hypothetical protein
MSEEQPEYVAYLLRMWRVPGGGGTDWRASLERPRNGERVLFASLEKAIDFLLARAGAPPLGQPPLPEGRDREGEGPR